MRRNIMGDILKEAIADAKAVRETALANAKMALEEAFTPQLKSMLAAKLREDDDEFEDEEGGEDEDFGDDEEPTEDDFGGDEEEESPEEGYDEDHEGGEEDFEDEEGDEEDFEDEEVAETIEVNGKTYALVSEDDEEEIDYEDDEDGEEDVSDLDLEAIIRELEDELSEEEEFDEDAVEESDEFDDEEVNEDDEFEIDETLFEEDDEDDEDEEDNSDEIDEIKAELGEYKEAVVFLKDKLHEVNILNAKLLFTNKLFKEFNLDNNQKLKVVETFDRAQSTREIKLVYSTLAEQFSDNGSITRKHSIKESASTKSGSTKPKRKIITEENQVADRFRKLAGLL